MAPRRAEITIRFDTDLDQLKGWGYEPQDWINLITESFARQTHYHTSFKVLNINIRPPRGCTPEEYLAATKGA